MLGILAHTFMTATRTDSTTVRPVPPKDQRTGRKRWLPEGHWWVGTTRCIDLEKL